MTTSPSRTGSAVVLGGGLAGMLAAAALADRAATVTVVERDRLPDTASPRRGLPQARHAHLLYSGGARAVESLLPGTHDRWLKAGARRVPLPTGLVTFTAQGWLRRWPETQYMIVCSRDLLDHVVRRQALALPAVSLVDGAEAVRLTGDARRVTGVVVRDAHGAETRLEADLVVDATGRGSSAPRWLAGLGLPAVPEHAVDSGLAYATRIFRAPAGSGGFPVIGIQPDPRRPVPGQSATLLPIEDSRWLVTLSGTRGGQPSASADEFVPFARQVRHPLVGDLIARAQPLTDIHVTHSTVNRRRLYEKMTAWPAGFVVLGDAVAAYNPLYGQGMSVAAQGAALLRETVRARGLAPGVARDAQRAIGRLVQGPWDLAVAQDILYPGTTGRRPPAATTLLRGYMDRLMLTATGRAATCRALFDVLTLSAPVTGLVSPTVAIGVLRGPGRPLLAEPPLGCPGRSTP
ncbi:FAD-dependent monooxygenase [Streptomyces sp. UNOB3_S3]|uniref:FAD-dependent monooxygenase n=1 Tax=Streptomyces sp. UNOB3_S3 TaxID=2871682 RepID=UPI001E2A493C|nr:FAD-dependent monooxygenase [Streptomyces sp. UNOB3_S3]MCC3773891.1 FAD-dependent monooxygenase [Streptomyces sp. UNOB3_S3]